MKDGVLSQTRSDLQATAEAGTDICIDFPPTGATLPIFFTAGGTLPSGMFPTACYIEIGSTRIDAERIRSRCGGWVANFTDVPPCDGIGRLTVESATQDGTYTSSDCRDNLTVLELCRNLEQTIRPLPVSIDSPAPANCVTAALFFAKGTLDNGTQATECYFLCTSVIPNVKTPASDLKQDATTWTATFKNVPLCKCGTLWVHGDDGSADGHGNISVKASC
jgi:hypothetical protein